MTTRSPSPDLLTLGRGILRWAPIVNGARAHWRDMGNVESLTVSTADTKLTKKSSRTGISTIYKEITSERTVTLTIQGDEFGSEILAAILQGKRSDVTVTAGGNVSGEDLFGGNAPGELDVIAKLAHPLVSSVVLHQGGTTFTIVAGDYEVIDAVRGWIKILGTGAIDPDVAITANYTWDNAAASERIDGGTLSVFEAALRFAADNAQGPNRDAWFYRVSLTPDGDLGFISTEYGSWTLKATLLDDSAGLFGGSDASPLYELRDKPVEVVA